MRISMVISTLFMSAQLFAIQSFHHKGPHTYVGTGEWKTSSATGTYDAKLEFNDKELTGSITTKGESFTYHLVAIEGKNGFFQVTEGKEKCAVIGSGYCFGHVCHYGIHKPEMAVEETFYFTKETLYSMGSKVIKGERVAWTAKLGSK